MRIAHFLRVLVAVLSLAAVVYPVSSHEYYNQSAYQKHVTRRRTTMSEIYDEFYYKHEKPVGGTDGVWLDPREAQKILRHEITNQAGVDCCPTVVELVELEGGKNRDDVFVELFRDKHNRQHFYEHSCHKDILNKPCRFMDRKLHNHTKCVQKYSYTYALVKDPGKGNSFPSLGSGPNETRWTLDYIRVRSGCSCIVTPNVKKRNRSKNKRRHGDGD